MLADPKYLKSLRDRVASAKRQDRRLDYELFCVFAENGQPSLWDPHEGNDFTSSPALRQCTATALGARIQQAEALDA